MFSSLLIYLKNLKRSYKVSITLLVDVLLVFFCLYTSYYITLNNFNGDFNNQIYTLIFVVPIIIVITSLITDSTRVVISAIDLNSLYKFFFYTLIVSTLIIIVIDFLEFYSESYLKLFIVLFLLFLFLTVVIRLLSGFILNRYGSSKSQIKNVALFGAGSAGKSLFNSQRNSNNKIITFVDDNKNLMNTSVFGIDVLDRHGFEQLAKEKRIDEIWIGIADIKNQERKSIIKFASKFTNKIKSIPPLNKLIEDYNLTENLIDIDLNNYLGRANIDISKDEYSKVYSKKIILITGAGGSIGSQLCKTLIDSNPKKLILLDSNELSLYNLEKSLDPSNNTNLFFVLGNLIDEEFVKSVINKYKVEIILHAAAYKHVPLVENNILSSLKNNVISTKSIVHAALELNIERFVLVSSDKAVRPSNIMGVSKRLSEIYVKLLLSNSNIHTSIVRFGNVLGSSGSVIPLFQKQIMSGGPVTVTDINMTRYFMSIEEASQLILIAGKFGTKAETYLLDMGKEIKILDLAKNMIKLANLNIKDNENPNGDIEIVVTDKRPGEKLYEELLIDLKSKKTDHNKVMLSEEKIKSFSELRKCINDFELTLRSNDENKIKQFIGEYSGLIGYEK
ncbi:polysaccharide biosynthesis protein [Pelagibacteraceae bacterium]|nr:polysaccharide biosynthesis protein [Pelagibacteraceae bacterium]